MAEIINPLEFYPLFPMYWRRADTPWGAAGACPLIGNPFAVQSGSLVVDAIAISMCPEYGNVAASGFEWKSADGVCWCFNETPFSGGEMYDNGKGEGTTISAAGTLEPTFANALIGDEEVA